MTTKKKLSKEKIPLIVAIIGIVGTLGAAVIGILPKIFEADTSEVQEETSTPVSFNRYDDPSGLFSIEYPDGYVVASRNLDKHDILVQFLYPNLGDDGSFLGNLGMIMVLIGPGKAQGTDVSQEYESSINSYIKSDIPSDSLKDVGISNIETKLISGERKENGFRIHFQSILTSNSTHDKSVVDIYYFSEYKENLHAIVFYSVPHERLGSDLILIDHVFSGFYWLPAKANELFAP